MKNWKDIVLNSKNKNVLLMLSGGKDSIAALVTLVKENVPVTAIHFTHKWGEEIPTQEAKNICKRYNVKLIECDFTEKLYKAINGYTNGRPCLVCKKQMYLCLDKYLKSGNFGWLAIGDNANDSTTIARMKKTYNPFGDNLLCSNYFGTEMGCSLPSDMHVLRPLIYMKAREVEEFLAKEGIQVKRLNSTGDKYFEYHREGCPIQFIDNGYKIDYDILNKLQIYNCKITEFARKKGIRASIHMPSTFIVTIPEGYEKEAAEYMEKNGLTIDYDINFGNYNTPSIYTILLELSGTNIVMHRTYVKLFNRILERIGGETYNTTILENEINIVGIANKKQMKVYMNLNKNNNIIFFNIINNSFDNKLDYTFVKNLMVEIFRTRKITIIEN